MAVILSGCGYLDGVEIRESVLALLALDSEGIEYDIFAPDIEQCHVINHLTKTTCEAESRNVLQEASRIARRKISALSELRPEQFDGLVLPGGFGAAKNLSTFAFNGSAGETNSEIELILKKFYATKKPIGAICISPALLSLTFGNIKPKLTIGNHTETSEEIEKTGSIHLSCGVNECIVDTENLFITTPAYMEENTNLMDIFQGITKLVKAMQQLKE